MAVSNPNLRDNLRKLIYTVALGAAIPLAGVATVTADADTFSPAFANCTAVHQCFHTGSAG